jgi:protein TonB
MVLLERHAQRHSRPDAGGLPQAIAQIQPVRILGMAGAIALNAAALMLLLVPVSAPMRTVDAESPPVVFIEPKAPPPPPPPIEEVPVVRPRTETPMPQVQQPPQPQPPVQQEAVVPEGNTYVPPIEPTDTVSLPVQPDPGPMTSTRLEYASAPAPTYPREAILDGIEGTVLLKVLVGVDGKPLSVEIERSSGHRRLDDAARRQVLRRWMFKPAIRDGQAVQVYGMVPVNFSLTRG